MEVGGLYRYIEQCETGYDGIRTMGWKMVFTKTGMSLTFEDEAVINGRTSSYHEDVKFVKNVKLKEMECSE